MRIYYHQYNFTRHEKSVSCSENNMKKSLVGSKKKLKQKFLLRIRKVTQSGERKNFKCIYLPSKRIFVLNLFRKVLQRNSFVLLPWPYRLRSALGLIVGNSVVYNFKCTDYCYYAYFYGGKII